MSIMEIILSCVIVRNRDTARFVCHKRKDSMTDEVVSSAEGDTSARIISDELCTPCCDWL